MAILTRNMPYSHTIGLTMRNIIAILFLLTLLAGCGQDAVSSLPAKEGCSPVEAHGGFPTNATRKQEGRSLVEARRGFRTNTSGKQAAAQPVPEPPAQVFRLI